MDKNILNQLCLTHFGEQPQRFEKLPQSGSNRIYIRLHLTSKTIIGVFNPDIDENSAFINLAKQFEEKQLPVPQIFAIDESNQYYLCSDHGNRTLFDILNKREKQELGPDLLSLFKQSLQHLIDFQLSPEKDEFYDCCNNPSQFDERTIIWDLNYFKYNFLKYKQIQFNEFALEDDFERLAKKVANLPLQGFMYRDFQSRNIMIEGENPTYIDFQGGRKGPLQYDVISFLWQARANLTSADKELLLNFYLEKLEEKCPNSKEIFMQDFGSVQMLRLLQVLGAYGYRGLFERKNHFIKSIPQAIEQTKECWTNNNFEAEYPELNRCIEQLSYKKTPTSNESKEIIINITSFSFLNGGYPTDESGHGGGYIFDCRCLPNPGRQAAYKLLTGRDQRVIDFLKLHAEVQEYIDSVYSIVEKHAINYSKRGFDTLNIGFGCTGGQHRSIYCAENINKRFLENGFKTKLWHREFPVIE